jgi:phenylacetate-CoA ligase
MFNLNSSFYSLYYSSPYFIRNVFASAYAYWSSRKKYGRTFHYWRNLLEKSQWWNGELLQKFQIEQLKGMIQFVYENCPFYSDAMRENRINPGDVNSLNFIKHFPIIDRQIVRENYERLRTRFGTNKKLIFSTSGTTGMSLHVPLTEEALQREYAFRWQYHAVAGANHGDKFAFFSGHRTIPVSQKRPPFYIKNYTENTIMFSIYHMADATLKSYVDALNAFKPKYIVGYPSGIFVIASFMQHNCLHIVPPKAIFTASETLHEYQKEVIERVFEAHVYQWYGQVEMTVNLHECDQRRLHVKEEYGLFELLKDDGSDVRPGETGRVIGTGFGNRAFPLIRYDTGDNMLLSTNQNCPCGRGGRIIEKIMGRDEDFIITPEGRYVGRLDFVFKPIQTVRESQIIQEDLDRIVVRVVPLQNFSGDDERLIIQNLKERIGNRMSIRVERVDRLPRAKSGKIRYVVSNVTNKYWTDVWNS